MIPQRISRWLSVCPFRVIVLSPAEAILRSALRHEAVFQNQPEAPNDKTHAGLFLGNVYALASALFKPLRNCNNNFMRA
jgi:hypothetical protein